MTKQPDRNLIERAVALAQRLQETATQLQTPAERRQQAELDRMLQNPEDKATLVQLTDQAFRSRRAARTAEQFTHILDVQGIPRFFSPLDKALLHGFKTFGGWLPGVSVPLVKSHLQQETANVVLPAEQDLLRKHLSARRKEGIRMNLNFLGEAMLGEGEARHRLEKYLAALQMPEVEVLSVKISTLYSQILPIARKHTIQVLSDRLERLYRAADRLRYRRADGTEIPKFIYLDMEEYRDLSLTAEVFIATLSRPGLEKISGGIALQAYVPDSYQVQAQILTWAQKRVASGGAPVTIRLVKGANLEMERVDASLHNWPQAPFLTKAETDANFKAMLHQAMRPEHLAAVRVGIASHNLFDLAYGLVLAQEVNAGDRVQFEMLEGMANHQRRALLQEACNLLLYAPACSKEDFLNAIGYLIRRLDENTGPENFLRHAFRLKPGSDDWKALEAGFRAAFEVKVSHAPRRTQNRLTEKWPQPLPETSWQKFRNEPDTDWSLPQNGQWAEALVAEPWQGDNVLPLVRGGEIVTENRPSKPCVDPSRPGIELCRYLLAEEADVEAAVACAKQDGWKNLSLEQRNSVLGNVAKELRQARGRLMQAALRNGGKLLTESDPEVSEAVDFVEFYRACARFWLTQVEIESDPVGVVVVIPPWNFPIAIPCGGIAAALAAGNSVILKPASDTVLVAWELCQCFWRAGVPQTTLQFLPCPGSGAGSRLAAHPDVASVILTGGTDTARRMLGAKPDLRLFAETGGKNASIITAMADRQLAVKHVVQSAFGHGGQKCSATSLLLLEAEIYDDDSFKELLRDAVQSLRVGPAEDLASRVSPLIRPPSGELETGLKTLEPGETWLVMPEQIGGNPNLWSPGVKYGVSPGSFTHQTEFFGPLLGVMRFTELEEAIEIVNATGFGLTSAIHSLDDREVAVWKGKIKAGNLYINRGTTGAIVLRQPFGGMGKSCFGPGMKAGGPNYVAQFLRFRNNPTAPAPANLNIENQDAAWLVECAAKNLDAPLAATLRRAVASYDLAWREEFSKEHDHFRLVGQDNHRRYLPFAEICVRITATDSPLDALLRLAAARITGARVIANFAPDTPVDLVGMVDDWTDPWAAGLEMVEEDDTQLAESIASEAWQRIRFSTPEQVTLSQRQAAAASGQWLADVPVTYHGRLELLWYLREQSISHDYHRYGNLGARAAEPRASIQ